MFFFGVLFLGLVLVCIFLGWGVILEMGLALGVGSLDRIVWSWFVSVLVSVFGFRTYFAVSCWKIFLCFLEYISVFLGTYFCLSFRNIHINRQKKGI